MKNLKLFLLSSFSILLALLCFLSGFFAAHSFEVRMLKRQLAAMPGVHDVHFIQRPPYKDCLLFTYDQPVEYVKDSLGDVLQDAEGNVLPDSTCGYFRQRVMLGFKGRKAGTVMVTEGYNIDRYLNPERPNYQNELSALLGLNEVLVEHRYFMPSAPLKDAGLAETIDYQEERDASRYDRNWDHLTTLNAASDHHRIYTLLKDVLQGGWAATGASKGGLTSVMYTTYYPEDMDVTVPYVAPFCITQDDPRMAEFLLHTVGTEAQREEKNNLVREILKRKNIFWDRFVAMCDSAQWQFQLPLDTVYQLAVLDLPVGLWMYEPDTLALPAIDCPNDTLWAWLADNLGPAGLACDRMPLPYDIQAAKELGCYCYDVNFCQGEGMTLQDGTGLWQMTYLPADWTFSFDTTMHHRVEHFLRTTTRPIVCVNGQNDPWTAVGFSPLFAEAGWSRDSVRYHAHDHLYFFTLPRGNHGTRITAFPEKEQAELKAMLQGWLK